MPPETSRVTTRQKRAPARPSAIGARPASASAAHVSRWVTHATLAHLRALSWKTLSPNLRSAIVRAAMTRLPALSPHWMVIAIKALHDPATRPLIDAEVDRRKLSWQSVFAEICAHLQKSPSRLVATIVAWSEHRVSRREELGFLPTAVPALIGAAQQLPPTPRLLASIAECLRAFPACDAVIDAWVWCHAQMVALLPAVAWTNTLDDLLHSFSRSPIANDARWLAVVHALPDDDTRELLFMLAPVEVPTTCSATVTALAQMMGDETRISDRDFRKRTDDVARFLKTFATAIDTVVWVPLFLRLDAVMGGHMEPLLPTWAAAHNYQIPAEAVGLLCASPEPELRDFAMMRLVPTALPSA